MSNQNRKKILYLITKSNWGGAQKYIYELAIAARAAGHEVAVAYGGTGKAGAAVGHLHEALREAGIPTYPINHFARNMSPLNDIQAFFEVLKLLHNYRPTVLHTSSSKAGGIGALAGRLLRIPKIIFTSHGLTTDETWRPKWQQWLIYLGTWLTLRLSRHTIMISTDTVARARNMPSMQDRVSLIFNGVAPIDFLDRKTARAKLAPSLPQNALWIGGVGELHPNKNWSVIIEAMTALPEKTKLIIIGEGEERPKLSALIKKLGLENRVYLAGFHTAAPLLKAIDIFVLPSIKEGLPYVLIEAGLASLPTVASNLPGNQDIIKTGETGLLVEPTATNFATTLQMLVRDEGMRRRLGQAHKAFVEQTFSVNRMCRETFSLYDSKM